MTKKLTDPTISYYALPGLKTKHVFRMFARHTLEFVEALVVDYYEVKAEVLYSKKRDRHFLTPRHVSMFLMRKYTAYSLKDIGKRFHRDHTSVMHAVKKVEDLMETDESMRRDVQLIENAILA